MSLQKRANNDRRPQHFRKGEDMGLMGPILFFLCFVLVQISQAKEGKTYLPAREVKSQISSVDESVGALVFSEVYPNRVTRDSGDVESRIVTGQDLNLYEISMMREFLARPGDPGKKKLLLVRYGIENDGVGDCVEEACRKISTTVITDLNRALVNPGESKTTDFSSLSFNSSNMAKIIERWLGHLQYSVDPNGILSIPVYPSAGDRMKPIMHLKILLLIDENHSPRQIDLAHGANNLSDADRVNTLLRNVDPAIAEHYLSHMDVLAEVLRKGGEIKDMPQLPPIKVLYNDGYRIVRFTDGQQNPNDNIAEFLTEAVDPKNGIVVDAVHGQEFVMTHRKTVDAMKNLMEAQAGFQFNLIADSRFVSLDGYGLASVFEGFNVYPDRGGKPVYGVNRALQDRSNIYVYAALGKNRDGSPKIEKDLSESHMTRKLEHNKILFVTYTKNGEKRARIYFGSMNLSNHFENAEDQEELDVPVTSWIYKALIQDFESIRQTQPENVIDLSIHLVREGLGRITGHTDLEVPFDLANQAYSAALRRDYTVFMAAVRSLSQLPSHLVTRPNANDVEVRLQKLEDFLAWYKRSTPSSKDLSDQVRLHKLISLSLVLSQPKLPPWKIQSILNSVLWRPNWSEEDLQGAIKEGWKVLGIDGEPNFKPREDRSVVDSDAEKTFGQFTHWSFDWDDNVMYMPTTITLFKVGSSERWNVSTQEFATARFQLGVEGTPFASWEIRETEKENSFYRFRSKYTGNYFLDDIVKAVRSPTSSPEAWQGPSWEAFVAALGAPETAANVEIVTARGHSRDDFMEGLKELQRLGLIKHLPKLENIHCVGGAKNVSERKVTVLLDSLLAADRLYYPNDLPLSIAASGKGQRKQILWGFSDDDHANYVAIRDAVMQLMKEKKIKKTKVTLYYTGRHNPKYPAEIKVITPEGELRDLLEGEVQEIEAFLARPKDACIGALSKPKKAS